MQSVIQKMNERQFKIGDNRQQINAIYQQLKQFSSGSPHNIEIMLLFIQEIEKNKYLRK